MDDVFTEVLAQVSPATPDANHHSLSLFSDGANKEFGRRGLAAVVEMIEFDATVLRLIGM